MKYIIRKIPCYLINIYGKSKCGERVKELELQISKLELKSQEVTTQIVTKVLTKKQIIREKGDEIIKYVDREIVKYDDSCKIPSEVVEALNKAAK